MGAGRGEQGAVTAEAAVAIPGLVAAVAVCLWGLMAAAVHLRCVEAARAGAREVARGEPIEQVREFARQRAPEGATVDVGADGDLVRVRVQARVRLFGGPGIEVGGESVALAEERVGG